MRVNDLQASGVVRIATSLDLRGVPGPSDRFDVLRTSEKPTLINQLRVMKRILSAGFSGRPLVLYSIWGWLKPDLLSAAILGLRGNGRPPVVMVGESWEPSGGWRTRVEQLVVRCADRGIDAYLPPSASEAALMPRTWPLTSAKVQAHRFYFFPDQHGLVASSAQPPHESRVALAAGDSHRDFRPLWEAAATMPDVRFIFATTMRLPRESLPANVEVRRTRLESYPALMREAGVVVVPLRQGLRRSAGILTFLMAMWLRRPVIMPRSVTSLDYLDDGVTGIVVDGSAADYRRAIMWALDPASNSYATSVPIRGMWRGWWPRSTVWPRNGISA